MVILGAQIFGRVVMKIHPGVQIFLEHPWDDAFLIYLQYVVIFYKEIWMLIGAMYLVEELTEIVCT